ncbi:tumor necrosis factor receptor superfamily member 4 [Fundulus heteroclitus]|uniref:tumor necrosis factor receptor superfamily member 4 n=1 Tax=Fundulus heteroclitus TaxID=8078 RepID=UPI00165C2B2F|nr:tumor necrosis factor receptor superfamily member 4 [Fundulus heteroclitus]
MGLCNLLVFLWTLNKIIVQSDALSCNKGERVVESRGRTQCVPCEDGYFQATAKSTRSCSACLRCDEESGSFVKVKCTKYTDTVCGCREGFVQYSSDYAICKCDKGSGLKDGVCSRCEEGYFSTDIDSSCQKWKDCKSAGIKKAGTATSDVICNEELNGGHTTTSPASIKKVFLPLSTTRRLHEGVQTQKILSSTTTAPVKRTTVRNTMQPSSPNSNTTYHIGTAILILGIVGLLVLTAVTCKLHVTPCWRTKPAVQTKDSLCRRPVEESGDSSESSLKLYPEP